jgi:hypothetical protein
MDEDDDTLDGYRLEIFSVQRPKAYSRALALSIAVGRGCWPSQPLAIHSTSLVRGSI